MQHSVNLAPTWEEYHSKIETLSSLTKDFVPEAVVCIARGGLRVGDILSRVYAVPLAVMFAQSYDSRVRGDVQLGNTIAMASPSLPSRVLLVDDIADSGNTLSACTNNLQQVYGVSDIKTAVLWYKPQSIIIPDYFVSTVSNQTWITQPFEHYDQL